MTFLWEKPWTHGARVLGGEGKTLETLIEEADARWLEKKAWLEGEMSGKGLSEGGWGHVSRVVDPRAVIEIVVEEGQSHRLLNIRLDVLL